MRMMQSNPCVTAVRGLMAATAVFVLAGCATKRDIRDIQTELRALALRQDSLLAELRAETLSTQDTLRTQSDQLFDFRGEISRQLREIGQSLTTLQAIAGENQRGIQGVREQLSTLRAAGPMTGAQPGGARGEAVGGAGGSAEQLWGVATGQLSRGSLGTARQAFQQFLTEYPNHENAPDARFFLADILAQEGRLEDAVAGFRQVQELYPTASRVPDALYRMAILQVDLGQEEEAVAVLERIVNTYPESSVALLARDKLDELK